MSTGIIIAISVVGGLVLLGGLGFLISKVNRAVSAKTEGWEGRMAEELPRRGWTYAERDDDLVPFYNQLYQQHTQPYVLEPFVAPPHAKAARMVITGVHRGRPFVAAVFDTLHKGQYTSHRAIWVRTPVARPALTVQKVVPMASGVNDMIGTGDVQSGDPDFDARFDVRTKNAQFATAALSPDLVQYLLEGQARLRGFMLIGDQLEVFDAISEHRDPRELIPALDLRCDILDRMPAAVWA
ncbi:hypothetical protein [Prauserella cavernicola]|uniref:DUF3137 domain-containing protein n=1 Tax=Prauserella cavernicola TaxID=2800127 RepID=A0A934QWX9_9PSEU|nr:hypothetical protein [Prauserella cavernicola]MBK1786809.1 hypothetical protein [Prauserella cavernicola]